MINFRLIARAFSLLLIVEGLFMLLSGGVSFLYHEHSLSAFLYSALITVVTGIFVYSPLSEEERFFRNREGYIIVTGIFLIFCLFGTLPYIISGSIPRFTDAFFEAMSGFTTTGATILPDVEKIDHGILFWRSVTQWLGGIGIILISLSVFPVFKAFNIQIAAVEFSGQMTDKIHPRTIDAAKRLISIYFILTLAEMILLALGGMPVFDAVCHSLSTLSTGGFSTRNDGFASFATPYLMIVMTVFMFLAGTNMTLIYFGAKGNLRKVVGNSEFRFYAIVSIFFVIMVSLVLIIKSGIPVGKALLDSAFHVISVITTTGFFTQDHALWGGIVLIILFILMFTGGTSGSTSGGLKIIRLVLITKNNRQELKRLIHPNAFIPVRCDKKIVSQNNIYNLLVFITLYFFVMCIGAFAVSFMGYDMITSFSTSASMLANIGPALGDFGPFTNYSALPEGGKIILSMLMLLGRLELLSVMILFSRSFYKN